MSNGVHKFLNRVLVIHSVNTDLRYGIGLDKRKCRLNDKKKQLGNAAIVQQ